MTEIASEGSCLNEFLIVFVMFTTILSFFCHRELVTMSFILCIMLCDNDDVCVHARVCVHACVCVCVRACVCVCVCVCVGTKDSCLVTSQPSL